VRSDRLTFLTPPRSERQELGELLQHLVVDTLGVLLEQLEPTVGDD
jgi:hypothetical protein